MSTTESRVIKGIEPTDECPCPLDIEILEGEMPCFAIDLRRYGGLAVAIYVGWESRDTRYYTRPRLNIFGCH